MALLSRITAVCDICKVSRTFSTLRANPYHLVKPPILQILKTPAETPSGKRYASIFSIFLRPSVQKLKLQDNIPDEYQLIYRNTMYRYLLAAQVLTTVSACLVGLTVIMADWSTTAPGFTWDSGIGNVDHEMIVFVTSFIAFCAALQFHIARMPIRIYYLRQQKNYIMILYRSLPFMTRRVTYGEDRVMKLPTRGILPWNDCKYEVTNVQKVILIENYFRKPADFNIMLGYQKSSDEDDDDER